MNEFVKRNYNLFRILYAIRYFGDAFFNCFFQLFLVYNGLSEGKIGIICAITPLTVLIASPIWNHFCKNVNVNRKVIRIITILEGITIIVIGNLTTFEMICVGTFVISCLSSPFYSLLDGFCGSFCDQNNKDYPIIRAWGSLTYAIACGLGGILIQYFSFTSVFLFSGLIYISCSIIIHFVQPLEGIKNEKQERHIKEVLSNRRFLMYLIFYIGAVVISMIGDSFLSVYYKNVQSFSSSKYGILYFGIVIIEVITMFLLDKFCKKTNFTTLILLTGFAFGIRNLAIALNLPLPLILIGTLVRGVGFGLLLFLNLRYLVKIVSRENLTSAITIEAVCQVSVQAICLVFSGALIERYGYSLFYGIIAGVIFSSTILYEICHIFYHHHKKSNQPS